MSYCNIHLCITILLVMHTPKIIHTTNPYVDYRFRKPDLMLCSKFTSARCGRWSFKIYLSHGTLAKFHRSLIPCQIFSQRLLEVTISFTRLRKSQAHRKFISLDVSQSHKFTICHQSCFTALLLGRVELLSIADCDPPPPLDPLYQNGMTFDLP